jgi:hypothetical protein
MLSSVGCADLGLRQIKERLEHRTFHIASRHCARRRAPGSPEPLPRNSQWVTDLSQMRSLPLLLLNLVALVAGCDGAVVYKRFRDSGLSEAALGENRGFVLKTLKVGKADTLFADSTSRA